MQKKIIALAVAALASTAAFAQTNVTIYGIADASGSGLERGQLVRHVGHARPLTSITGRLPSVRMESPPPLRAW